MSINAFDVAFAVLGVALLLTLARALRGPSLPDRVAAMELTSMISVSLLVVRAIAYGWDFLLDVAIVLALVAFLATIAFASFLERSAAE